MINIFFSFIAFLPEKLNCKTEDISENIIVI